MKKLTVTLEDSLVLLKWVVAILIVFVLIFIINQGFANKQATDRNFQLGKESNTYHRTVACILSVPLADRTDDYISNCYLQAELKNGVKVDHFGNK